MPSVIDDLKVVILDRLKSRARDSMLKRLPERSIGAEVGVWRGDFSDVLIKKTKPRRLHLIDPWRYEPGSEYAEAWYGGRAKTQLFMDEVFESVRTRFADEINSGQVVLNRATGSEAAAEFADGYFDWVYIDGNHLYEFVKADLEGFAPKVRPGGFLLGDDYGAGGWWKNGVKRAVDEFVSSGRGRLVMSRGGQFAIELDTAGLASR